MSTSFGVVERPDHRCGDDDLVLFDPENGAKVYVLHKWLILIFLKTTEVGNSKTNMKVVPEVCNLDWK